MTKYNCYGDLSRNPPAATEPLTDNRQIFFLSEFNQCHVCNPWYKAASSRFANFLFQKHCSRSMLQFNCYKNSDFFPASSRLMSQLLVANYFIMLAKGSCDKTSHSLGFAGSVVLRSAVPQIRKNNMLQISGTILDKTT